MNVFVEEFKTLSYIIGRADSFLLIAHSRPDADTIGSTLALAQFLHKTRGKSATLACFDPFPPQMLGLFPGEFLHPNQIDLDQFEVVIGCDSVDRGFNHILPQLKSHQTTVAIDHHLDIGIKADVNIIDTRASSTCELVFSYLERVDQLDAIDKEMATMLLAGILFDTGNLQHACTTPRVMDITGTLIRKGAPLKKTVDIIFNNKNISALRLWGRAFEHSIFNRKTGMIATAITQKDMEECEASSEDVYNVASILSTVPEAKFSLVLTERDTTTVRAHLRSMERHNIDVSVIAHQFGGGGHKLASGFEIPGKISQTPDGWIVT